MTDTADRILDDLRRRRDELRPLVDELQRIEAAIDALEQATAGNGGTPHAPVRTGRRRGRPRKGEPNRTDQFLALVRSGGTSIPAAANALGIGPNYLYRIAGTLESEGTIRKEGREYVMAVEPQPEDDNAETLPQPDEGDASESGGGDEGLVTEEGVNEGTSEIAEE
jgi:hypothetical protein